MKEKKKILIAPNSFKECADSVSIAHEVALLLNDANGFSPIELPLSDGGDGFLNVCKNLFGLQILKYSVTAPYDESKIEVGTGYDKIQKTIYIESANVLGMKVIPAEKRHPIDLSSKGIGELILNILNEVNSKKIDVEKLVIGIGGTGTNDLGLGMCSIFGLKLFDEKKNDLEIVPKNFNHASQILWDKIKLPFEIELLIDVENSLLGKNGATQIFGKQKGSTSDEIEIIEKGFESILKLLSSNNLYDPAYHLSGAGGGLAAGFQIFFNGKLKPSGIFIKQILKNINKENIKAVITGEGSFDRQSLMNKAPGILLNIFKDEDIPIFFICGLIEKDILKKIPGNVVPIELVKYFRNKEESIKEFKSGLKQAVNEIINSLN